MKIQINFRIGWISIDKTGLMTWDIITKRNHFIIFKNNKTLKYLINYYNGTTLSI